jgi:DNA-binding transcriptional LysR family regulator
MGGNFLEWCKRNNVYLDISETKRDLDAIDIAGIRIGAMPHAALEQVRLLDVSLVVAAAPSIAATSRPTDATWWSDQTLLDPEISEGVWPVVWKKLGLASVVPRHRLRFSSYLVALDAARSERGIVLAPSPFVEADLNTQKLMKLTNIRLSAKVGYDFVLRRELAISPRGRALRRRLVAAVKA